MEKKEYLFFKEIEFIVNDYHTNDKSKFGDVYNKMNKVNRLQKKKNGQEVFSPFFIRYNRQIVKKCKKTLKENKPIDVINWYDLIFEKYDDNCGGFIP